MDLRGASAGDYLWWSGRWNKWVYNSASFRNHRPASIIVRNLIKHFFEQITKLMLNSSWSLSKTEASQIRCLFKALLSNNRSRSDLICRVSPALRPWSYPQPSSKQQHAAFRIPKSIIRPSSKTSVQTVSWSRISGLERKPRNQNTHTVHLHRKIQQFLSPKPKSSKKMQNRKRAEFWKTSWMSGRDIITWHDYVHVKQLMSYNRYFIINNMPSYMQFHNLQLVGGVI